MKVTSVPKELTITLTVTFDQSELDGLHSLDREDTERFREQLNKELGEKVWQRLRWTLGITG